MITLEEAKAIADTHLTDITECTEMTNAYIFINPRTKCSIGGPDYPIIVMKEDGQIIPAKEAISTDGLCSFSAINYILRAERRTCHGSEEDWKIHSDL